MVQKLKLAILISGRGSNLQAIIQACQDETYPASIDTVISNNPDAAGLEHAAAANIHTHVINHKDFETRELFDDAMHQYLEPRNIDLICLAGFMRILSSQFAERWPMKIINIHPSLLPHFKGLHPQKQALEAGAKESGCTVHFVVPELDSGPTIIQRHVPIEQNETEKSLSERILKEEHIAYPEAIKLLAENRVEIINDTVEIQPISLSSGTM